MDAVIRGVVMYAFLLLVFRLTGKRTLAQITTFDFVLLLIIGEATQNALLADDFSLTNSFIIILTLLALDVGMSLVKRKWPVTDRLLEGLPVVVVENGKAHRDRMAGERIDEEDVMVAAREQQGLERLEQVKYAVVERSGGVSVVPKDGTSK
jgi:uncharacterized membrane protein YcaP (DUF421 family)